MSRFVITIKGKKMNMNKEVETWGDSRWYKATDNCNSSYSTGAPIWSTRLVGSDIYESVEEALKSFQQSKKYLFEYYKEHCYDFDLDSLAVAEIKCVEVLKLNKDDETENINCIHF